MNSIKILLLIVTILPGISVPSFSFAGSFFGGVSRVQLENEVNKRGLIVEGATGAAIQAAIGTAKSQGIRDIYLVSGTTYTATTPILAVSNLTIHASGAVLHNTAPAGTASVGLIMGQGNREDIGRSHGVEETAHYVGALSVGDVALTVGNRWNNTASDWINTATYTPQVGDLVMVATTDDLTGTPSTPVPSATYHRKIVSVSGSDIVLDRGVKVAGEYMLIPTSRDLGYDRTGYGGYGRMETIENFRWIGGKIISDNGHGMLTGGLINGYVQAEIDSESLVYGNGMRDSVLDCRGVFHTNAVEVAIGSEDSEIFAIGSYGDIGNSSTVALVKAGEQSTGIVFRKIRIDAPGWNDADAMSITAHNVLADDVEIVSGATSRLLVIGATGQPARNFRSNVLDLTGGVMTGRLVETVGSGGADGQNISVVLRGNTSSGDAVIFRDSGIIRKLEIVDDAGVVRFTGSYTLEGLDASGTLVFTGTQMKQN